MFIAALFTIVKKRKQAMCPSLGIYIYILYKVIPLSHKKNKILLFAATWMDLEGIMLSEISQRKTNTG